MTIIDRRDSKKKSVGNRQRFIRRYKKHIKRNIQDISSDKGITDVLNDRTITIPDEDVSEPSFGHDPARGKSKHVLTGNRTLKKGDRVDQPPKDDGKGPQGSDSGDGFDEFTFTLTKEEFLELYFSDMELPDFIKERIIGSTKEKWKRHGYSKDGIPSRLDLPKTLKQALARKIATKSKRFLDNVDMRYKHFTKQPFPIRHAVMFCIMDVSASMGAKEKELSKRFFLLLYLFLHKSYDSIDIRFVRHTQEADEVEEKEFFYGTHTGGTVVSSGLNLVNKIIDEEYNLEQTNIYISQASDGDNFSYDTANVIDSLHELLTKVQYFVYVQVDTYQGRRHYGDSLWEIYEPLIKQHANFNAELVEQASDIYPALHNLFTGE